MAAPKTPKPKRDRVSLDLTEQDRELLEELRKEIKRNMGVELSDGNVILCVYRKWGEKEFRMQSTSAERKGR